jgi:hypothetical protein
MDPVIAAQLIAASRQLLMLGFSFAEAAGKTAEEIDEHYAKTKGEFMAKPPEGLPDPPDSPADPA